MEALKFWSRPAIATALWVAAAAMTLSELSTVAPSLRTASSDAPHYSRQPSLRARAFQATRTTLSP